MERVLYRLENAFIVIISFYVFLVYETTWTRFLFFLILPKLIYLIPPNLYKNNVTLSSIRRNVIVVFHSYSTVLVVASFFFLFMNMILWSILGWVIHIAIDRVIKYKGKSIPHPLFQARG